MDFGCKAPTPTALKQPTHTQKSTHQQHSVSCVNLKKKLLVKIENTKTCEHLCCQLLNRLQTTVSYCTQKQPESDLQERCVHVKNCTC